MKDYVTTCQEEKTTQNTKLRADSAFSPGYSQSGTFTEKTVASTDGRRSAARAQRPRRGVGILGSSHEDGGAPGPGFFDMPPLFLTAGGTDNVTWNNNN